MCLAIAMYLVTGTISIVLQVLLAVGIFLLTLLGKIILFVCAMIYTVVRPMRRELEDFSSSVAPFETMYPEYDFEDDLETMTRVSLETIVSRDNIIGGDAATPIKNVAPPPPQAEKILITKRRRKSVKKWQFESRSIDAMLPGEANDEDGVKLAGDFNAPRRRRLIIQHARSFVLQSTTAKPIFILLQ